MLYDIIRGMPLGLYLHLSLPRGLPRILCEWLDIPLLYFGSLSGQTSVLSNSLEKREQDEDDFMEDEAVSATDDERETDMISKLQGYASRGKNPSYCANVGQTYRKGTPRRPQLRSSRGKTSALSPSRDRVQSAAETDSPVITAPFQMIARLSDHVRRFGGRLPCRNPKALHRLVTPICQINLPGGAWGSLGKWLLSRNHIRKVTRGIEELAHQNLVSIGEMPAWTSKNLLAIFIHPRASLLDTRYAAPGRRVLTDISKCGKPLSFEFTSPEEVIRYWKTCELISQDTPLGYRCVKDPIDVCRSVLPNPSTTPICPCPSAIGDLPKPVWHETTFARLKELGLIVIDPTSRPPVDTESAISAIDSICNSESLRAEATVSSPLGHTTNLAVLSSTTSNDVIPSSSPAHTCLIYGACGFHPLDFCFIPRNWTEQRLGYAVITPDSSVYKALAKIEMNMQQQFQKAQRQQSLQTRSIRRCRSIASKPSVLSKLPSSMRELPSVQLPVPPLSLQGLTIKLISSLSSLKGAIVAILVEHGNCSWAPLSRRRSRMVVTEEGEDEFEGDYDGEDGYFEQDDDYYNEEDACCTYKDQEEVEGEEGSVLDEIQTKREGNGQISTGWKGNLRSSSNSNFPTSSLPKDLNGQIKFKQQHMLNQLKAWLHLLSHKIRASQDVFWPWPNRLFGKCGRYQDKPESSSVAETYGNKS
ncbi:unnamed protein product [Protopolystoma xenopodis]|uniref:Uncharacterized protein n=1 Tax=Protopolystoma xenopodis TaxID=117903 RepID=A0A448WAL4_9PLAT|nr:unnamed protein product [Protopolystoma xenopodis]